MRWKTERGGGKSAPNFSYAELSPGRMLTGDVAMRAGKQIQWDGPKLKTAIQPEASHLVHTEPRLGWVA